MVYIFIIRYLKKSIIFILVLFVLFSGFDISAEVISPLAKLREVIYLVEEHYVDEIDRSEIVENAISGIVDNLDIYTTYLTSEEYSRMRMEFEEGYGGIGIEVTVRDGKVTIVSPIKGTPADKADLQSGDIIVEIDGNEIIGLSEEKIMELLAGEPGTTVTLKIQRKEDVFTVSITRVKLEETYVSSEILEGNIGYISLSKFGEGVGREVEEEIKKFNDNVNGIILDLRNNPGGMLEEAVNVTSNFLERGTLISIQHKTEEREALAINENINTTDLPLVILINAGSASASEIVTAAIRDYNRGTIFGTSSFGKGTIQTVLSLRDNSALRITTARYYTAVGNTIEDTGIEPDFIVKKVSDVDNQLNSAIKYLDPDQEFTEENDFERIPWYRRILDILL